MGKTCFQCLRVLMIIFNVLFVLIGLAILGLVVYTFVNKATIDYFQSTGQVKNIQYTIYALIGVGILTVVVGGFGCCGAYHESPCLLGTYFTLLLIVCISEAAAGALGIYFQKDIRADFDMYLNKSVVEYKIEMNLPKAPAIETDVARFINSAQKWMSCCGVNGSSEYDSKKIPNSCCKLKGDKKKLCGDSFIEKSQAFEEGCKQKYPEFVKKKFDIILFVAISVAGVELFGLFFSMLLCCSIQRRDSGYMGVDHNADQ